MVRYQILAAGVRDLDNQVDVPPDRSSAAWERYRAWLKQGNVPSLPPTEPIVVDPAETIALLTIAVQEHLDAWARARGYDSILSACSYAASTDARFGPEGRAAVAARDAMWAACYLILAAVEAGTHEIPTEESLIAALPPLAWPA